MSYSFTARGATKDAAKAAAAAEFDQVVVSQPTHQADKDAALAATNAYVDLLTDLEDGKEIVVSVNGYLSWTDFDGKAFVTSSLSVTASITEKL
jgi:hypothetical protein